MNLEAIEVSVSLLAGVLIILSQAVYVVGVFKKEITPSILSWFGWSLLMGASVVSQIVDLGWQWSILGVLISTIGCLLIGVLGVLKNNYSLEQKDWVFLLLGLICLVLYIAYKDPWLTTVFAITSDFVLAIPTIIKAYKKPLSEKSSAWIIGVFSWSLTLITCVNHELILALFPIYLFLFTGVMVWLTNRNILRSSPVSDF